MRRSIGIGLLCLGLSGIAARPAVAGNKICSVSFPHELSLEQALGYARQHNHELIVKSLERERIATAELSARVWPNPEASYHLNNVVLGRGNDQERDLKPKPFSQLIHSAELTQVLDVSAKRRARLALARANSHAARLMYLDAQRELTLAVRLAYTQVLRAQQLARIARETANFWQKTHDIFRRRHSVGELAALEVDKLALEHTQANLRVFEGDEALGLARHALAGLLALDGGECLPPQLQDSLDLPLVPAAGDGDAAGLTACALCARPDVAALKAEWQAAERAAIVARREVWPDVALSLQYTRSHFQISGDNPHAFGFGVGVPLPIFDRNRAARTDARLAKAQTEQQVAQLAVQIGQEVRAALASYQRSQKSLATLAEDETLARATRARDAAERAQRFGARSLLEVLEAQRTLLALERDAIEQQFAAADAHIQLLYVSASETIGEP